MIEHDDEDDIPLVAAATVLLARDRPGGPEVLMLRRNSKIAFGGAWVFPGGRVDPEDHHLDDAEPAAGSGDPDWQEMAIARRAAIREAREEAGLDLTDADLVTWSHWQPPKFSPLPRRGPRRRFSTWFFITAAPDAEVLIDHGEIHEHRWLTPAQAFTLHEAGEIELVPPTWLTLRQLAGHATVAEAMAWAAQQAPPRFHTKHLAGDPVTLTWEPDVFHAGGGPDDPGPRHRLVMHPEGWLYEQG